VRVRGDQLETAEWVRLLSSNYTGDVFFLPCHGHLD
jgi:hypothetical protein